MSEKNTYKAETTSSFINFLSELINYVAVVATAIITLSLSIFMDLINSTCNLIRTGFTTFLSKRLQKNLKFKYNYGTEKLETLSMIFCDTLFIIGTIAIFGFAIYQIFNPRDVSDAILVGVILKSVNVIVDSLILFANYKVYKKTKTKVAKENFEAQIGSLAFDLAIFISVLLAFVLVGWEGAKYVEPISSIIIAVFIVFRAIGRMKTYVGELINVTISEQEQQKIDLLLAKYIDRYELFYSADSHKSGDTVYIDFKISFTDETKFKEIKETLKDFTKELENEFDNCKVTLIIDRF